MRTARIHQSDTILDEEEKEWWNVNAETIEKIWAQNIHFQKIIRLPYLSKMKNYFLDGATKLPVKILEIGCGTGWVCRLIADENFHVIGTDFSEGQLSIANKMAKIQHKDKFCTYELADASTFQKEVDGVVIHALLHHLTKKELELFFEQFSKLPSGTKVFMYEPIFFFKQSGKTSLKDKLVNKLIQKLKAYCLSRAKAIGKEDIRLTESMGQIYKSAEANHWYISPKEVPFYEGELENLVNPHCTLVNTYIVNKTDLDIAQALTFNSIEEPDFMFRKILIPLATWLDKCSFSGKFTHFLYPNQHLFVCFEWIKK